MGEYYSWVNVDKKEYLEPLEFGLGCNGGQSSKRGNELLSALYDLLSKEWAGDHIFWMGDEKPIAATADAPTLRSLYAHSVQRGHSGDAFETVLESYKNVSGLFRVAEAEVRAEIVFYLEDAKQRGDALNQYGIDITKPFDGLFMRNGLAPRYVLNHTRRLCYSPEHIRVIISGEAPTEPTDPLPFLLQYGRVSPTGFWVGDGIGVAEEPPEDYVILENVEFYR